MNQSSSCNVNPSVEIPIRSGQRNTSITKISRPNRWPAWRQPQWMASIRNEIHFKALKQVLTVWLHRGMFADWNTFVHKLFGLKKTHKKTSDNPQRFTRFVYISGFSVQEKQVCYSLFPLVPCNQHGCLFLMSSGHNVSSRLLCHKCLSQALDQSEGTVSQSRAQHVWIQALHFIALPQWGQGHNFSFGTQVNTTYWQQIDVHRER